MHLCLTLLTVGWGALIWILVMLWALFTPTIGGWVCERCGERS